MSLMNIFRALLIAIAMSATALAETLALNPDAPERYTVAQGDTLWDISSRFLKDPWLWPEIWQVNPSIENPHLIFPGDVLSLVYGADGKPRVTVSARGKPTVKLSPEARSERLDQAIPTIPMDAVGPFLSRARVMSKEEYDRSPYIVAFQDEKLIAANADKAYVRGSIDRDANRFTVVRIGEPYRNPGAKKNDILGYEMLEVASARLEAAGDPASFKLDSVNREVLAGDRVIPVDDSDLIDQYMPHPASGDIEGVIIAVLDGVSRIGQFHTVVLNIGSVDGVERGHVFDVMQSGRTVRDTFSGKIGGEPVVLPDEDAGVVMVYRVFDRVSYGLIMRASRDIRLMDSVRPPKSR